MRPFVLFYVALVCGAYAVPTFAHQQTASGKPKSPAPQKPVVSGQNQQVGGDGVFGEVLTTNDTAVPNWNLTLVSAAYSVEVHPAQLILNREKKYLLMRFQLKNVDTVPKTLGNGVLNFALVDTEGNTYEAPCTLHRDADHKPVMMEFRPGQGVTDLSGVMLIPAKATISKIILQTGRKGTTEKVLRYYIANVATKERDGKAGNPKNIIAPLAAPYADSKDKTGTRPDPEGFVAKLGTPMPFNDLTVSIEGFRYAPKVGDMEPEDGQKLLVCTVALTNGVIAENVIINRELHLVLVDADGEETEVTNPTNIFKGASDERIEGQKPLEPGKTYRARWVVSIPANKTFKRAKWYPSVEGKGHALVYDLTDAK